MGFFLPCRSGWMCRLHQTARVSMLLAMLVFQLGPAYVRANPVGEEVVAGQAQFDRAGSTLTIHTSDRVIINWQDFSIASGELTKFVQPDVTSAALNRVISGTPSSIMGTLQSNGQIFLINPNGILVGGGAVIDTGGFVASTFDVSNSQFLQGGNLNFTGESAAGIRNEGKINAIGGDIILIARQVENKGLLQAAQGTVGIGAGGEVLLAQSGVDRVFVKPAVSGPVMQNGVVNSGVIEAARVELKAHGNIYALAINNSGVARATGSVTENGRVMLTAPGGSVQNTGVLSATAPAGGAVRVEAADVKLRGTVEARGVSGRGGEITVTGEKVEVASALIDASGDRGGGVVRIGGDLQGKNPDVANARQTTIASDVDIRADALSEGDGGRVVVWADNTTSFGGTISARGGAASGDGGFAEVSGKEQIDYYGFVDLRAAFGKIGTLLLDPKNIAITSGGPDPVAGNSLFTDNPAGWSVISGGTLGTAIDGATVTLQANNDIFINDDVTATAAGHGLTLQAGRYIVIEQNTVITLNGGDFSATVNDNAAQIANRDAGSAVFSMENGAQILTQGGDVTVTHGNLDGTGAGRVTIGEGTSHDGAATISTGAGNISITGAGETGIANGYGVAIGSGSVLETTSGNITVTGTGGGGATDSNFGVFLLDSGTRVTTASGAIGMTGNAGGTGAGHYNYGLVLQTGAQIQSTGAGTITLEGNGGGGEWGNHGLVMYNSGTAVTSADGAIDITGAGGAAAGGWNPGVRVEDNAVIQSTGSATITVTGTGGNGAENNWGYWSNNGTVTSATGDISITGVGGGTTTENYGIFLENGAEIHSTGSADVTMDGTGSIGSLGNHGLKISASQVTTVDGNISITGLGRSAGTDKWNYGIYVLGVSSIASSGGGMITLDGTGGNGTIENHGIVLQDAGTQISSVDGAISITGVGGAGSQQLNYGIYALTGAKVISTGTATVTLDGTGGAATWGNHGVVLTNNGTAVTSVAGDISITGVGGGAAADGWNVGVRIEDSAAVQSTGGAAIDMVGTGGSTAGDNWGVWLTSATVSSTTGDISVSGTAGGTDPSNWGILLENSTSVTSTGSAGITLTGRSLDDVAGVKIQNGSNVIGGPSDTGDITITAGTASGADDLEMANVSIQSSGNLILRPYNTASGIGVAGGVGQFNLSSAELGLLQNGFSKITIGRPDGTGTVNVNSYAFVDSVKIQSAAAAGDGAVLVAGDLSTSTAGDTIELYAGKGVGISADVITNNGNITIQGNESGTYGGWAFGVDVNTGANVSSGNGNILMVGTGGNGVGDWTIGVRVQGSTVQSTGGDITIQGTGGALDSFNPGILIEWSGGVVRTATGDIVLTGVGGGQGNDNWGVSVSSGGVVESTGTGTVAIDGTGGPGTTTNYGVRIAGAGSTVSSVDGAINIVGDVDPAVSAQWNHGVDIDGGGQVLSTGLATITITGTGGAGTFANNGVRVADSGTLIRSATGDILLTGTGGAGSAEGNLGIVVEGGADIQSTGSARITLDGTGGVGDWGNHGVLVSGSGTTVTSVNGDIAIDGTGASAPSGWNVGAWIFSQAVISSTGNAAIDITGTAGNAGASGDNWGVMMEDAGTRVTSVTGDISITGTGRGTTDQNNIGLYVRNSAVIESTGASAITLQGSGAGTAAGIAMSGGSVSVGGASATGDITFIAHTASGADSISLANLTVQSSGNLFLMPLNAGTSVGLAGGAGTFNLSATELGFFQDGFSQITIGRSNGTGTATVGAYTFADPVKIQSAQAGGAGVVSVSGLLQTSTAGDSIELVGGRGVTLNAGITTNDGNVTIKGNESGTSTGFSFGVDLVGSTISTGAGDVVLTGVGGDAGDWNIGIRLTTGAAIQTTSGDITLDGSGGPGGSNNIGVLLEWASTTIQSDSGDILINGAGGGSGSNNFGILIQGTSVVQNNTGLITLDGAGAAGTTGNHGVKIDLSRIESADGDILIDGDGGSDGSNGFNYGIQMVSSAVVESTGLATITLNGTGAAGTVENHGVVIEGAGTAVTTDSGDIAINGAGGAGTAELNFGIYVKSGAVIEATGAADVTLIGYGGAADWGNHGVVLVNAGTDVCVTDGNLLVQGYGGNGVGGWNIGVRVDDFAVAESCGTGSVTLEGTGGNGPDTNWGFWGFNGMVSTNTGDITITGIGNGTTIDNYGIYLQTGTVIVSLDTANIVLDGRGAGAAAGIRTAGAGNEIGGALMTGDITLTADTAAGADSIVLAGLDILGGGNVTLQPLNAATTIGLGNSATGVFNLSDSEIALIDSGIAGVTVGRSNSTGAMDIRTAAWNAPLSDLRTSGAVTLQGTLTGAGTASFNFNKAIALTGATSVDTSGSNGSIAFGVAVTGGQTLALDAGAGAISIAAGLGTAGTPLTSLSIATTDATALTQGGAWYVAGALDLSTGGAATLTNGSNQFGSLGAVGTGGNFSLYSAGDLAIDGPVVGANDVTIRSGGILTLNGTVTAQNATLVTPISFVNTAGAAPFTVTGRFLIYSVDPALNTLGGLVYPTYQYGIVYPAAPSFASSGLLYSTGAPPPDNGELLYVEDVLLPRFADSYDRFDRYQPQNWNDPNFFPLPPTISFSGLPPGTISLNGILLNFSSFNLVYEEGLPRGR